MSKLKNIKGFTDRYKELLSLSPAQVKDIDEMEYQIIKDKHWNYSSKDSEYKDAYMNRIRSKLTEAQLNTLDIHLKNQKIKAEKRKKEKYQKAYEWQSKRLKDLSLSKDQLEKFVAIKNDFFLIKQKRMRSATKEEIMNIGRISALVYEEQIYPIFNDKQLKQFKNICEKEEQEANEWRTNLDKEHFEHRYKIKLSNEQAIKLFSKENAIPSKDSDGEYYSEFETFELELILYKEVLTEEQFENYRPFHKQKVKHKEESIIKSNTKHHLEKLNLIRKNLQYYIKHVLPARTISRKKIEEKLSEDQKKLIGQIKVYYFEQLENLNETSIKQHKRYYKDLSPNLMEESKLRHKFYRINPSPYFHLYDFEPTKELMTKELIQLLINEKEKLESILEKEKAFNIKNFEQSGGSYGGGWHIKINLKEGEEHLEHIGILLLEPELQDNLNRIEGTY